MSRTTLQLAVGGLALSALMLTACSSGTATPPVAHLAGSSGATASLTSAVHLYESLGFRHRPPRQSPFVRANVFMELSLTKKRD